MRIKSALAVELQCPGHSYICVFLNCFIFIESRTTSISIILLGMNILQMKILGPPLHIFVFCRSCEESMIVIQVKYLRWKTSKRKTPRKEQGLRIAITMGASSWMADGKRLSKSGGSDLISDCPERNLIGMQPAPICLKYHRWRICLEFHFGCTWNPWEREATKRRGGGMRDCLGSQMATIWSTSISILNL